MRGRPRLRLPGATAGALLALAAWAGAPAAEALLLLAGVLAVASGWHMKYTLVRRAAFTPRFDLRPLPGRGPLPMGSD